MRIWLLALMIALLPLRGWVGDAMALGAGPAGVAVERTQDAPPPCHGLSTHADTGEGAHTTVAAPAQASDSPGSGDSDHAGCTSCDICHGTVLNGPAARCSGPRQLSAQPSWQGMRFASAVLPGRLKPPIS